MDKKQKRPALLVKTPVGTLRFPWLNKKDSRFAKSEDEAKYKTAFVLPLAAAQELMGIIDGFCEKAAKELGRKKPLNPPYKIDEEAKEFLLNAHTTQEFICTDARGTPLSPTPNIWSGTQARLAVRLSPYEGFGGGVTAYLHTVRIINLVTGGGDGDAFAGEEDDGFVAETQSAPADKEGADALSPSDF